MKVGISEIGVEIPSHFVSVEKIARARGMQPEKAIKGLGAREVRIPYDSTVIDLATQALKKVSYSDIERFYFATESNPDASKPEIGVKTLRNLGLNNVVLLQSEFACVAGVINLIAACEYTALTKKPSIVLAADRSIYREDSPEAEVTQGCAAVALRIEIDAKLMEIDFQHVGSYVADIDDFKVPYSSFPFPVVQGELSTISFLHCVKAAFDNWKRNCSSFRKLETQETSVLDFLDFMAFHTPFPKMVERAAAVIYRHEKLREPHLTVEDFLRNPELFKKERESIKKVTELQEFKDFFEQKIIPSMKYHPRIGNSYTANVLIAITAILEQAKKGNLIGICGYGSGAGALVLEGKMMESGFKSDLEKQLKEGKELSFEEYQEYRKRESTWQ